MAAEYGQASALSMVAGLSDYGTYMADNVFQCKLHTWP